MPSASAGITLVIVLLTALMSPGRVSSSRSGSMPNISGASSAMSCPAPSRAVLITGIRLSAAAPAESMNSLTSSPMSASGLAIPATRFSQADFVIAREPCIVDAASLLVVPVMPISVCITWIASTISA